MNGGDWEDLIKAMIIIFIFLPVFWLIITQVGNYITQSQIQPYLQQLEEKDREIAVLKEQINQLQNEK